MSDESKRFASLLRQIQQGSHEAARELTDTYGSHLQRCVRRALRPELRSKFDSLDFVQLVWKSVFEEPDKLAQLESPEQLARFLAGVAKNKVAGVGRHLLTQKHDVQREVRIDEKASHVVGPHPASRDPTPSAAAIFNEQLDRLVEGQPPQVKRIVELRYQGNTFHEIAARLHIHERTARKVMKRLEAEAASGRGAVPRGE